MISLIYSVFRFLFLKIFTNNNNFLFTYSSFSLQWKLLLLYFRSVRIILHFWVKGNIYESWPTWILSTHLKRNLFYGLFDLLFIVMIRMLNEIFITINLVYISVYLCSKIVFTSLTPPNCQSNHFIMIQ